MELYFVVIILSRYRKDLREINWNATKMVLRYFKEQNILDLSIIAVKILNLLAIQMHIFLDMFMIGHLLWDIC